MKSSGSPLGRSRILGAAFAAALLLGGNTARAESCPAPDLKTCQVGTYYTSECGKQHQAECDALITEAWSKFIDAQQVNVLRLTPESMGAKKEMVKQIPADRGSYYSEGGHGTFAGVVAENLNLAQKPVASWNLADILAQQERDRWAANGTKIESCEEYIYERYHEYHQVEARALRGAGIDGRAFFDAAYAADGFVNRTLYSYKKQSKFEVKLDGKKQPKNAYYTFKPGPYPAGQQAYAFDKDLVAKIDPKGASFYARSFTWHQDMSKSQPNFIDDELIALADQQRAFEATTVKRAELYTGYQRAYEQLVREKKSTKDLDTATAVQLRGIDAQLEKSLKAADKAGCLTLATSTACDWSPSRFVVDVSVVMNLLREAEYQRCLRLTGNDFGPDSIVHHGTQFGLPRDDANGTLADFQALLDAYEAWLAGFPELDPATRAARTSGARSDRQVLGNSTFGVGYEYHADWGLTDLGTGNLCNANVHIGGDFQAFGEIFGNHFEALYARAGAATEPTAIHVDATLRVAGAEIYSLDQHYPARFSVSGGPSLNRDIFSVGFWFALGPIPVHISAGAAGGLGLELTAGGGVVRDCPNRRIGLDLTGRIRPWAHLDAFAAGSVDIFVAEAGIRGSLTLVSVSMPLTGTLGLYLVNPADVYSLMFQANLNLGFDFEALNGRFDLFGRIGWPPFGWEGSTTLFSWPGIRWNHTLLNETFTVPVARL